MASLFSRRELFGKLAGVAVEHLKVHAVGRVLKISAEIAGFAMGVAAEVIALLEAALLQLVDDGAEIFIGHAEGKVAAVEVGLGRC